MYNTGHYTDKPLGNNALSYTERMALGSTGKLRTPSLIQGTLADLQTGSEICFEEVEKGRLISCTGLQHFVQLDYHGTPIVVIDNHNHALSFWIQYQTTGNHLGQSETIQTNHLKSSETSSEIPTLIHIDQHADTKENNELVPPFLKESLSRTSCGRVSTEWVEDFTNVGNFITVARNSNIVSDVIQVRTDYALQSLKGLVDPPTNNDPSAIKHYAFNIQHYILDIDIDFRVDKEILQEDIFIIRQLIKKAKLVTIATSPYFIDQSRAIEIIKQLLAQ